MDTPQQEAKALVLEERILELEIELAKTQLAGLKQTVVFAMEKGPQLEAKIKGLEVELFERRSSTPKADK